MKISPFCTPGAVTDALRKEINAPEFGERLIGRLNAEAIPGIAALQPAERPLTHVHLLDPTTDGKLSFYIELSGVTPREDRNLGFAATIIQKTVSEAISAKLPPGLKMDLFVVVTPTGGDEPIELLATDICRAIQNPDHTD